ncbi:hypothetical protein LCGC14_2589530 [marine sediment metagenome]|uniref:AB hydrolase-1 domain-containing protein n=1 Tax=marine sediment metagenome TaxID=412755 RepID=A0A0F9AZX6_9ZZZZ
MDKVAFAYRLTGRLTGLVWLCLCLFGCSLGEINRQSKQIDDFAKIEGRVLNQSATQNQQAQMYVLLFQENAGVLELMNRYAVTPRGDYIFHLLPGEYTVAAFADDNLDVQYLRGEPAVYLGMESGRPERFVMQKGEHKVLPTLVIERAIVHSPLTPTTTNFSPVVANIGKVISLDDPIFSSANAKMGLWRPVDFLETVGGGMYMLQDYQPNKIPIIFIHGINGHSAMFSDMVAAIDRTRFQPWVLYYPSGVRLDMIRDYLLRAVNELQAKHQFQQFYLVAHSMGGLMARSFVQQYQQNPNGATLGLVVTVNSPLAGIDSAATGVRTSPIVLPVWRDVASNSDYIKKIQAERWPEAVPYYLVFSYQQGKDGDGVVPMRSQLSLSLQQAALAIVGFDAEHTAILKEPVFIEWFQQLLVAIDTGD